MREMRGKITNNHGRNGRVRNRTRTYQTTAGSSGGYRSPSARLPSKYLRRCLESRRWELRLCKQLFMWKITEIQRLKLYNQFVEVDTFSLIHTFNLDLNADLHWSFIYNTAKQRRHIMWRMGTGQTYVLDGIFNCLNFTQSSRISDQHNDVSVWSKQKHQSFIKERLHGINLRAHSGTIS